MDDPQNKGEQNLEIPLIKVYVAERGCDYEGFSIIGIFETRKEAQSACDEARGGDFYEIEEYFIGDIPK